MSVVPLLVKRTTTSVALFGGSFRCAARAANLLARCWSQTSILLHRPISSPFVSANKMSSFSSSSFTSSSSKTPTTADPFCCRFSNNSSNSLDEELAYLENAVASYEDVAMAGPPVGPPPFPSMKTARKVIMRTRALDRKTDRIRDSVELIYGAASPTRRSAVGEEEGEREDDSPPPPPRYAYYIEEEYKRENKLGLVHVWKKCRMATRRATNEDRGPEAEDDDDEDDIDWEIQPGSMVVQCILWGDYARKNHREKVLEQRTEDARAEIAALQYVARRIIERRSSHNNHHHHSNLRAILDVLEDDMQWWIVTPVSAAAKEDLFTLAQKSVFTDTTARFWFQQVLNVRTTIFFGMLFCRTLVYAC
jgi:hypothetical protein